MGPKRCSGDFVQRCVQMPACRFWLCHDDDTRPGGAVALSSSSSAEVVRSSAEFVIQSSSRHRTGTVVEGTNLPLRARALAEACVGGSKAAAVVGRTHWRARGRAAADRPTATPGDSGKLQVCLPAAKVHRARPRGLPGSHRGGFVHFSHQGRSISRSFLVGLFACVQLTYSLHFAHSGRRSRAY